MNTETTLAQHIEQLKSLQSQIDDLKETNKEIRGLAKSLNELVVEIKHTNETVRDHETRLDEIERKPGNMLDKLNTALISALVGGLITYILTILLK